MKHDFPVDYVCKEAGAKVVPENGNGNGNGSQCRTVITPL